MCFTTGRRANSKKPGGLAGWLLILVFAAPIVFPGEARQAPDTARRGATVGVDVLVQSARIAAGGEAALNRVTSLSASVRLRRFITYLSVEPKKVVEKDTVLKGKIQIEFEQPDKFRKRVTASMLTGDKYTYAEIVHGSRAWRYPSLPATSSSRSRHVIDVSDFERSLAYQAQGARQQFSLYALAFLIHGFPADSLKFTDGGTLQTEQGKADVVRVSGPDDFHAGMLLDQATHLPLGLIQDVIAVRPVPVIIYGVFPTRSGWQEVLRRARHEREIRMKPPRRMRVEYRLLDRRVVDGISLPHRINTLIDGKLAEELVVSSFKINSRLNPRDFEQKGNEFH